MCIEDYRLGRFITFKRTQLTFLTNVEQVIATASRQRVGIIAGHGGGSSAFRFDITPMTASTAGLLFIDPDNPTGRLDLWLDRHGQLVQQEIRAKTANNNIELTVFEFFLDESILHSLPDQFKGR